MGRNCESTEMGFEKIFETRFVSTSPPVDTGNSVHVDPVPDIQSTRLFESQITKRLVVIEIVAQRFSSFAISEVNVPALPDKPSDMVKQPTYAGWRDFVEHPGSTNQIQYRTLPDDGSYKERWRQARARCPGEPDHSRGLRTKCGSHNSLGVSPMRSTRCSVQNRIPVRGTARRRKNPRQARRQIFQDCVMISDTNALRGFINLTGHGQVL